MLLLNPAIKTKELSMPRILIFYKYTVFILFLHHRFTT
jgi:hypothetical protein